jgi:SAM-dependent methyltransferase
VKQVEVSAADIARIARVRPSAVSNWRRRHDDFPRAVSGSDSSPRFDLAAVEAWLRAQGRMPEISADERLWQAFESARGVMPTGDALVAAGLLLYYLHRHPGTPVPYDSAEVRRVLDEAEHALAFGNSVVAGLIGLRRPFDPGSRETTMLHAVAQAASGDAPARVFEYLCSRALDGGARTGLTVTPPELADLMLGLAGDSPRRLLDPACGSGTILLAAARRGYSRVEGQELDRSLALVSALRLAFTGASFDVSAGDSLRADAYPRPSADAVVCSPPFADRSWGAEDLADDPRWEYGTPPRLEPELAWVQHALAHVAPGGPVVMLMPPAAAARPSGRRLRRALVAGGALRAVISLPPKLAAHYALALQIWVLSRPELDRAYSHVLLVDASGFATRTARAADAISTWDKPGTYGHRDWSWCRRQAWPTSVITWQADWPNLPGCYQTRLGPAPTTARPTATHRSKNSHRLVLSSFAGLRLGRLAANGTWPASVPRGASSLARTSRVPCRPPEPTRSSSTKYTTQ